MLSDSVCHAGDKHEDLWAAYGGGGQPASRAGSGDGALPAAAAATSAAMSARSPATRRWAGVAAWPSTRLSSHWHPLAIRIETPTNGRGGCSRMAVLSMAVAAGCASSMLARQPAALSCAATVLAFQPPRGGCACRHRNMRTHRIVHQIERVPSPSAKWPSERCHRQWAVSAVAECTVAGTLSFRQASIACPSDWGDPVLRTAW